MKKRNRRSHSPEFKREAVKMVEQTDKTIAQVSRELGIGSNLIGRWFREQAQGKSEAITVEDKDAEIRRLQAELRDLKDDHEIVKKAATYFAKHSR